MQQLDSHVVPHPRFTQRFDKDPGITRAELRRRGTAFEMLELLDPRLQDPKLVSSAYGGIDTVLLTIPAWIFEDPTAAAYMTVYDDLVGKLPQSTALLILTNEAAGDTCRRWIDGRGLSERATIGTAPDTLRFSIWAEDAYCMAVDQTAGGTFFVESASFDRYDDEYIADEINRFTDLGLSLANLYFQGGNVLIGDDFWLIGMDYPNNSFDLGYIAQQPGESKLDAIRRAYGERLDRHRTLYPIGSHLPVPEMAVVPETIDGETWRHVVHRGNVRGTTQPVFHIDMFLTLLGRNDAGANVVMVGDPGLAEEVLGPLEFVTFARRFSLQAVFDSIADLLASLGFVVVRNPLPSAYVVDRARRTIEWYFATANNALVQVTDGAKDIWMPQYGFGAFGELQATDARNREILEEQGFTVHGLGDFHPFAYGLGAVHCISKYIARSAAGDEPPTPGGRPGHGC